MQAHQANGNTSNPGTGGGPAAPWTKIGVVGTGLMGAGIAETAIAHGLSVVLVKATPGPTEPVVAGIAKRFARRVGRGKMTQADADAALALLTVTTARDALAGVNVVIECIIETLEDKRALFAALHAQLAPDVVFATNTSTLSVADIAEAAPGRPVIGLHFFSPVPAMELVEVIAHGSAEAGQGSAAIAAAVAFAESMGKSPVVVENAPGFIVNRLLVPFLLQAIQALAQGLAPADAIDKAMKLGCGHPMGPLALCDLIGLDIVYAMAKLLFRDTRDPACRPPALLRRLVQDQMLGRKTGRGFFDYSANPAVVSPALVALLRAGDAEDAA